VRNDVVEDQDAGAIFNQRRMRIVAEGREEVSRARKVANVRIRVKRGKEKLKLRGRRHNVTRSGRAQTCDGCQCHPRNTCFAYIDTRETRDRCLSTI